MNQTDRGRSMRIPLLIATVGVVALTACQQTTATSSEAATTTAAATSAAPPADAQSMAIAQRNLSRYGFDDVDPNTLSRDQIIRINRIDTIRKRAPEIRREISAILARSQ